MKKAIRIVAIVLVVGFIVALAVYNTAHPNRDSFKPWNVAMTMGDQATAEHHFVMYTDIFCPYCDKFSDAIQANEADFKTNYVEGKKIFFEIRVTDMNYKSGHSENSLPAGEGAYCAAKQNKFWEYYHAILSKIYKDYHSKGIGVDQYAEKIPKLEMDYFYAAADDGKLDHDAFVTCMENHETKSELDKNTTVAQNRVQSGVPYFVFDKYQTSGFLGNWNTTNDYAQAKMMLDAGLTTK